MFLLVVVYFFVGRGSEIGFCVEYSIEVFFGV